jgi:hypothetical protein
MESEFSKPLKCEAAQCPHPPSERNYRLLLASCSHHICIHCAEAHAASGGNKDKLDYKCAVCQK